jgi:hypothetical protein
LAEKADAKTRRVSARSNFVRSVCALEHFQAKWAPVRAKKMRSRKEITHPISMSVWSENALAAQRL